MNLSRTLVLSGAILILAACDGDEVADTDHAHDGEADHQHAGDAGQDHAHEADSAGQETQAYYGEDSEDAGEEQGAMAAPRSTAEQDGDDSHDHEMSDDDHHHEDGSTHDHE